MLLCEEWDCRRNFNDAIDHFGFLQDVVKLTPEHVLMIYENTGPQSTIRRTVIDVIGSLPFRHREYLAVAHIQEDFMADMWIKKLLGGCSSFINQPGAITNKLLDDYQMPTLAHPWIGYWTVF